MPHSYHIPIDDTNRMKRRANAIGTPLNTKGLPTIGSLTNQVSYDPNAYDGDGDGLVQDNTPYERPAAINALTNVVRDVVGSASLNYEGLSSSSWTVGLTHEQVAGIAVPDNPTSLVTALIATGTHQRHPQSNLLKSIEEFTDGMDFSPEAVKALRVYVARELEKSPLYREAVDKFGIPPHFVHKNKVGDVKTKWAGICISGSVIGINENQLGEGKRSIRSILSPDWLTDKVVIGLGTFANLPVEDIKTGVTTGTLRHEYGHYLHALISSTHPDSGVREAFAEAHGTGWGYNRTRRDASHPASQLVYRMLDWGKASQDAYFKSTVGEKLPQPEDNVPFVSTAYGLSQAGEAIAEMFSAYTSYHNKEDDLLNGGGHQLMAHMMSQNVQPGGLSSKVGNSVTRGALQGKSPSEIARIVVPSTPEEHDALVDEMLDSWNRPKLHGAASWFADAVQFKKGKGKLFDYSPERVRQARELVEKTLSENPQFHAMVQQFGMPAIMVTSEKAPALMKESAGAFVYARPMIIMSHIDLDEKANSSGDSFTRTLAPYLAPGLNPDVTPRITHAVVDSSSESTLMHEWGHFIQAQSMFNHPNEDTRMMATAYNAGTWDELLNMRDMFAKKHANSDSPNPMGSTGVFLSEWAGHVMEAQDDNTWRLENAIPNMFPTVASEYAFTTPGETWAEGVSAYLSSDPRNRALINQTMRRHIEEVLGIRPPVTSNDLRKTEPTERSGLSSFAGVARNADGSRVMTASMGAHSRDWLRDATHDQIADAVVPRNPMDAAILVTENVLGDRFADDPMVTARLIGWAMRMMDDRLRIHTPGEAPVDGWNFLDFSPQAQAQMKIEIAKALDESPAFSFLVRQFGMPPMMSIDNDAFNAWKAAHGRDPVTKLNIGVQHPLDGEGYPGGWSNSFYVAMFLGDRSLAKDHATGSPESVRVPIDFMGDGRKRLQTVDGREMPDNVGFSRADVLRHEWAHWYWSMMFKKDPTRTGSEPAIGRTERADRLARATGKDPLAILAAMEMLNNTFSTESPIYSANVQNRYRLLRGNFPDPSHPLYTTPWHPALAAHFIQDLTRVNSKGITVPIIRTPIGPSIYGNTTAQETWAEAVLAFTSPSQRAQDMLSPELRQLVAQGLLLNRDSDGSIEQPWSATGMSSRANARSIVAQTPQRVTHEGVDAFISPQGLSSETSRASVTTKAPGIRGISFGNDKWDHQPLQSDDEWSASYDMFATMKGSHRMRLASAKLMGQTLPDTPDADKNDTEVTSALRDGHLNGVDSWVQNDARTAVEHAISAMSAVHNGESSEHISFRGMSNVPADAELMTAPVGETINMPLTSFSPNPATAEAFSKPMAGDTGSRVVMRLAPGARIAKADGDEYLTQFQGDKKNWIIDANEYVTQGSFQVTNRTQKNGITYVDVEHTGTYNPLDNTVNPITEPAQEMFEEMKSFVRDTSREGLSSTTLRPDRGVAKYTKKLLEENMDALRDLPVVGQGGAELDDAWAKGVIDGLDKGSISSDDVMHVMNVIINDIHQQMQKSSDSRKQQIIDERQKLGKKLRRLFQNNVPQSKSADGRRMVQSSSVAWVNTAVKSFAHHSPTISTGGMKYTNPELHKRIHTQLLDGAEGGKAGEWSTQKQRMLAIKYHKAGGGYRERVSDKKRSARRTRQKWTNSKNNIGHRYNPYASWSGRALAQRQTIAQQGRRN